eukprot:636938_1
MVECVDHHAGTYRLLSHGSVYHVETVQSCGVPSTARHSRSIFAYVLVLFTSNNKYYITFLCIFYRDYNRIPTLHSPFVSILVVLNHPSFGCNARIVVYLMHLVLIHTAAFAGIVWQHQVKEVCVYPNI